MIVTFMPMNIKMAVASGSSVMEAAAKAGILIDGGCGGRGTCGKCKVKLLSGEVAVSEEERRLLGEEELADGYRLACKMIPQDNTVVEIPGHHKGVDRKKTLNSLPDWFVPDVSVEKRTVLVEKPTLQHQEGDFERLLAACGVSSAKTSLRLLAELHRLLEESGGEITVTIREDEVIDLEPGDTSDSLYGAAFDIGTTTVVGMLWDLRKKELLDVEARTNPQSVFGADVVSRIQHSSKSLENLSLVKQKIIDCINDMIEGFAVSNVIDKRHIYSGTVVGNTTMSHLFLGIDPSPLARTPFAPVFCEGVSARAEELGVSIFPGGEIFLLPNIGGHVGSDLAAALLSSRLKELPGANLIVDIGTNGEILLAKDGRILACSAAAGPAFEGASVHHGMRAAAGAIEGVVIENDGEVRLEVIGDEKPLGICGSGLIDVMAELLRQKLMDSTGRILTREKALEEGVGEKLARRLYKESAGGGFILYEEAGGRKVALTQKDVREVQLAKGAVAAGIRLMMAELGLKNGELDSVMIAGAFGNYIKKESALRIGLLPEVVAEKVGSIGNSAGAGASMALLSRSARLKVEQQAREVCHVELSAHPDFQDSYLEAMYFPEYD